MEQPELVMKFVTVLGAPLTPNSEIDIFASRTDSNRPFFLVGLPE